MEITLYKFSKKVNSTARPASGGTVANVSIKSNVPVANSFDQSADTYLTNPVFFLSTIDSGVSGDVNAYNYCYAFGHWYWIRNIEISLENSYTLFCEMDVLATFRDVLIGSQQYVAYSSAHGDSSIDDIRNLGKVGAEFREIYSQYAFNFTAQDDLMSVYDNYYVTLTHDKGTSVIAMTQTEFLNTFYPAILAAYNNAPNQNWGGFYGAPLYAIGQVMASMVDKSFGAFKIDKQTITLGGSSLGTYYEWTNGWSQAFSYNIPLTSFSKDYRDGDRLAKYFLYLPFAGLISIEASKIYNATSLTIRATVDYGSMDIGYVVFATYGDYRAIVGEAYGNVGRVIPFGQIVNPGTAASIYQHNEIEKSTLDLIANLTSGLGGAIGEGMAFGQGAGVGRGISAYGSSTSSFLANAAKAEINGQQAGYQAALTGTKIIGGSFGPNVGAVGGLKIHLYELRQRTMYTPGALNAICGSPTNKVVTIGADGYYQIPNPIIELDTVSAIMDTIIKFCKAGIFVE